MEGRIDLKACPFCGGEADIAKVQNKGQDFYVSWVECMQCHCSTHVFSSLREAAAAWNRRAE